MTYPDNPYNPNDWKPPFRQTPAHRMREYRLTFLTPKPIEPGHNADVFQRVIVPFRPIALYVPPAYRKGNLILTRFQIGNQLYLIDDEPSHPMRSFSRDQHGFSRKIDCDTLNIGMSANVQIENRGKYAHPGYLEVIGVAAEGL